MDKHSFSKLLDHITATDREVAQNFVNNHLPEPSRYYVHLRTPDTHSLQPGERVFLEDSNRAEEKVIPITAGEVVHLLWRDGYVPVWIDISVVDADSEYTYFQLLCAGRYAADESLHYYFSRGQGPFGIKSPSLPPFWDDTQIKFDLRSTNRRPTFQELPTDWNNYFENRLE